MNRSAFAALLVVSVAMLGGVAGARPNASPHFITGQDTLYATMDSSNGTLFYFWKVARTGHLTRAAGELNLSQSALSAQIRQLEARLGEPRSSHATAEILGGITRRTVIDILKHEGIPVHEMHFGRDALYVGDEVFLSGTAAEITPVREVDRRVVGTPGPITRRVQDVYQKGVHGEIDWLKPYITAW